MQSTFRNLDEVQDVAIWMPDTGAPIGVAGRDEFPKVPMPGTKVAMGDGNAYPVTRALKYQDMLHVQVERPDDGGPSPTAM